MRPEYYLPKGFIKKFYDRKDREHLGLFSFSKLLKKLLERFHIAFADDCCDDGTPTDEITSLPVRYNGVDAQLEFYNPETDSWEAVA